MSDTTQVATLRIEGEMGIYRAVELKPQLLQKLHANDALELDLSAVTEFDAAGLQLLMLAERVSRLHGTSLRLTRISDAVREVFDLLQLDPVDGAGQDTPADTQSRPLHLLER